MRRGARSPGCRGRVPAIAARIQAPPAAPRRRRIVCKGEQYFAIVRVALLRRLEHAQRILWMPRVVQRNCADVGVPAVGRRQLRCLDADAANRVGKHPRQIAHARAGRADRARAQRLGEILVSDGDPAGPFNDRIGRPSRASCSARTTASCKPRRGSARRSKNFEVVPA
jgi:hypothetical protein